MRTTTILILSLLLLDLTLGMDHRNHTGMRRLVKKKKMLHGGGTVDRIGYLGSEVVDYNIVDQPLTGYSYQYPDVSEDGTREVGERQTSSEMGGVMDFLAGTKLTNMLTLSLPIPLCELSDLCSSVDVALPFTVLQLFPASASRSMRKLEEEQAGLYKWVENLLDRYGLPGKSCVLRAVCELAEAGGLSGQGLAGRAAQAVMLMEYAEEEEALVDYLTARAVGRRRSKQCSGNYSCPLPLTSMASVAEMMSNVDIQTLASLLQAIPMKDIP